MTTVAPAPLRRPSSSLAVLLAFLGLSLTIGGKSLAAPLTWGPGGIGGTGTWDDSSLNWYDGTQNVAWSSGGSAIFSGMAGTVTANGETASSLAFEAPGYTLAGSVLYPVGGLVIQTDAATTIGATIARAPGATSSQTTLTKTGTGTLALTTTIEGVYFSLNQGEVRLQDTSPHATLDGMYVTLANAAGATLTLDQAANSSYLLSLSGGGTTGGVVQPANEAGTALLTVEPALNQFAGSFGGVLKDNGSGVLAVQIAFPIGTQSFTNANTYSGPTTIISGGLTLSGSGSLLNSPITIGRNGVLEFSTTGAPVISSTLPLTLQGGGTLEVTAATSSSVLNVGQLVLGEGASTVTLMQNPGTLPPHNVYTAQMIFAGVTRMGHATVFINGTNVTLTGIANDATGIAPTYITTNGGWATVGSDGSLSPYTAYATDLNAATPTSHVKLSVTSATLNADSTRASLVLAGGSGLASVNLGGHQLTLSTGGIYSSGSTIIQSGQLTTTANEWVVTTTSGGLSISGSIGETTPGTALTKSGSGALSLSNTDTYSGITTIQQGVLQAASDASLGTGSAVVFAGGTLQALSALNSAKSMVAAGSSSILLDTNNGSISLSGSLTGDVVKSGLGNLSLTQAPTGFAYVKAGLLSYLNGTSGKFPLQGGNLRASGSIDSVDVDSNATLDVGGAAPASLTVGLLENVNSTLTIDFGLGSTASDHLTVFQEFYIPALSDPSFQFEFQNLGGLMTGVDYSLIDFGSGVTAPDSNVFSLAPDLTAQGWVATFTSDANGVSVNFSSIPEPGSGALLLVAGGVMMARRRRRMPR